MSLAPLSSLVKVGAVTAAGAFLGALQLQQLPTTWAEARPVLVTAISAAVAAEVVFLATTLKAYRDGILQGPPPPTPGPPPPAAP